MSKFSIARIAGQYIVRISYPGQTTTRVETYETREQALARVQAIRSADISKLISEALS